MVTTVPFEISVALLDVDCVMLQWVNFDTLTFRRGQAMLRESASQAPSRAVRVVVVNEKSTSELCDDRRDESTGGRDETPTQCSVQRHCLFMMS